MFVPPKAGNVASASAKVGDAAFERHYSIGELAKTWNLGRETVRKLVATEDGVAKVSMGRKIASRYCVSESVVRRIYRKLVSG